MSSICKSPKLVIMSIILLIGCILALSVPFTYQTPTYDRERVEIISQEATLTAENPILHLNLTYSTFRVNIIELETNSTPVSIRAYNPAEFLDIQNVIFIDEIPLTIYSDSPEYNVWDEWGVVLVRENGDVNVSVMAVVLYYDQADVALAPSINFGIYGIPFAFIAFFWMMNIEQRCRIHKTGEKNWERKQGPIAIIVLILIASILIIPFASLVASGYFNYEGGGTRGYAVELTEESPSEEFELQEIMNNEYSEIYIETVNQEVQFIAEGSENTISWVIANSSCIGSSGWWLLFEEDTSYESLTLKRVNNDVNAGISVSYSTSGFDYLAGYSPFIGFLLGLAVFAFVPVVIAFVKAYRIDQLFRIPEEPETDDDDDESEEENFVK